MKEVLSTYKQESVTKEDTEKFKRTLKEVARGLTDAKAKEILQNSGQFVKQMKEKYPTPGTPPIDKKDEEMIKTIILQYRIIDASSVSRSIKDSAKELYRELEELLA